MKLLPNEEKLLAFNRDSVTLTNLRIQFSDIKWGQSFSISIFLENISSVETKYTSNPLLLILGAICIVAGIFLGTGGIIPGILLGVFFFISWLITRKFILSVSSNGGSSLTFEIKDIEDEQINNFIYNISLAKQTRVNQLHKL